MRKEGFKIKENEYRIWVRKFFIVLIPFIIGIFFINYIKDPMMMSAYTTKFNNGVKVINERQQKVYSMEDLVSEVIA